MKLVAATGNNDKLKEFRRILEPLGVEVISPKELKLELDVEENGATFADNAYLKALAFYQATGKPALADDSGLCVDALDGRPGVQSARYHGDAPYPEKMAALLEELKQIPEPQRTARFVCAICCVIDEDHVIRCEEACEGLIGYHPKGDNGFGYDPLFYLGERSMSELSGEEKDAISHRGKALRAFGQAMEKARSQWE